jgi:hypothetical protein
MQDCSDQLGEAFISRNDLNSLPTMYSGKGSFDTASAGDSTADFGKRHRRTAHIAGSLDRLPEYGAQRGSPRRVD